MTTLAVTAIIVLFSLLDSCIPVVLSKLLVVGKDIGELLSELHLRTSLLVGHHEVIVVVVVVVGVAVGKCQRLIIIRDWQRFDELFKQGLVSRFLFPLGQGLDVFEQLGFSFFPLSDFRSGDLNPRGRVFLDSEDEVVPVGGGTLVAEPF